MDGVYGEAKLCNRLRGRAHGRAGALLLATIGLAGCASSSPETHAHGPAALKLGQSATIGGPAGQRLRVTLLSYTPVLPGTSNDHPEFDYQFAAEQLRIQNLGSATYQGDPGADVNVLSTEEQNSKQVALSGSRCSERFAHFVSIAPGATAEGCVPEQVLVVATPAILRFAPFGPKGRVGRWSLRPPRKH